MAHGDAREGKWRGNWWMELVASTLHTTSEHGVSSITTADAHTSAASSQLKWRPRRFKWTRPFWGKTKCVLCTYAIVFQTQSTNHDGYSFSAFQHMLKYVKRCRFSSYDCFIGWNIIPGVDRHHFSTGMHLPKVPNSWSICVSSGKYSTHIVRCRLGKGRYSWQSCRPLTCTCHVIYFELRQTTYMHQKLEH